MRVTRLALLVALCGAMLFGLTAVEALAQETGGEAVRGTITRETEEGEKESVAGVDIVVQTADGQEIGTATTDDEGRYELELPGPGDYQATIQEDTLPQGVQLTNPDRATLEFTIAQGQSRPLLYPLGEAEARGSQFFRSLLQLFVEGIKFGLIIAMTAVGLSLIFGTTGLVNFAHGELVTFGALAAHFFNVTLGVHLIPAAILAIIVGGLAAGALDRGLWKPLRGRGTGLIAMLVISIGLSLVLRYVYLIYFGGRTAPFAQYSVQQSLVIAGVRVTPKDLIGVGLSILVLVGVALVLQRTKIGKAMRAVSDNRDLAESSGINVERVILFVWVFGGALATLGGVLLGLDQQVSWQMGFQLLLLMFAGVILGGLGTAYGALLGSLVVGIFIQTSTLVISPELKNVGALFVLILILLVRPQGLLGQRERVG
ncbi:MAG: ABC transporter permease subunit [Egibacteraceae bacterium]